MTYTYINKKGKEDIRNKIINASMPFIRKYGLINRLRHCNKKRNLDILWFIGELYYEGLEDYKKIEEEWEIMVQHIILPYFIEYLKIEHLYKKYRKYVMLNHLTKYYVNTIYVNCLIDSVYYPALQNWNDCINGVLGTKLDYFANRLISKYEEIYGHD
jgi:hypothetical protein